MRAVVLASALLLALPLLPPVAASHAVVERYSIVVDGETALGWLAYPTTGAPTTLLVYGHGCCGKPNQSAFVRGYAEAYGVVAVAMDYRGAGGWDVMKGSRDLVAATVDLQSRFPIARTVIWGVSMGGETTGMAVAQRSDLYDYWVDTFGVTNLFEEYAALGHYPSVSPDPGNPSNPTRSAIVRETGGTPLTTPQAYADRSPVLMADDMVGLRRAYITHGVGDPVVPYSMSREMFENLRLAGVPATLWTVTTGAGNVQPPYGTPAAPAPCSASADPCLPLRCASTPAGCVVLPPYGPVGPAAHDSRGAYPSSAIVDQLLRGLEPDAGTPHVEHVADLTAGQRVDAPRPG